DLIVLLLGDLSFGELLVGLFRLSLQLFQGGFGLGDLRLQLVVLLLGLDPGGYLFITGIGLLLQLFELLLGGVDLRLNGVVLFLPGVVVTGGL
ncbi:MAG: hypothetical protein IJI83_01155, partial [Oscillospiraceae bacterium]|nr:hypothetical protein [Oscillospiraceae bacterium]